MVDAPRIPRQREPTEPDQRKAERIAEIDTIAHVTDELSICAAYPDESAAFQVKALDRLLSRLTKANARALETLTNARIESAAASCQPVK